MTVPSTRGSRRRSSSAVLALAAWAVAATPALLLSQGEDAEEGIKRVVRNMSRALQAGNAPLFIAAFDRQGFPGLPELREQLTALTAQRRIASSVEIGALRGGPAEFTLRVDWLLELTPKVDSGVLERRHETLSLVVVNRNGRWKIARLEPLGFFSSLREVRPEP